MAATIPTDVPAALRAGDTWKWSQSLADYPAGDWTLYYRFKHPTAAGFEVTATADGSDYAITVAASATANYTAGTYSWIAWVASGSEKYTVGVGVVEIDPDYRSGTASAVLDDRSHARKTLAAIESWIEGRDPGVAEYEIAGRRMKYIPLADLLKLRQMYRAEVSSENAALAIANGIGTPRKIQFRL